MPRRIFPASTVTNTTGAPLRLTFHADSTTGRRETDLWTVDGSNNLSERIPNGIVLADAVTGAYGAFAGPDDVDTLYVSKHDSSTRTAIAATGYVGSSRSQKYINFLDYAPSSDTASVSSALLVAMQAAVAAGQDLYIPKRRYYLPTVVTLSSAAGLRLIGDGPDDTIFYHDGSAYMLDLVAGTYDTTATLLTVNAAAGDTTLTVASTARLTAGGYVNVQSDQIWNGTSGKNARYGELVRVKTVDSATQVTLYSPLEYAYTTANNGRVNAAPQGGGLKLVGLGFERTNPGTNTSGAMVIRQARGLVAEDLRFEGLDGPALTYVGCVGGSVARIIGRDMADDEGNSRFGYLHNIADATRDLVISDGHSYNVRHHVTTNANSSSTVGGAPAHNTIDNCSGTAGTNAIFSTHEEGDHTRFIGCRAYATLDMGFEMRATHSQINSCSVENAKGTGVYIQSTATQSHITDLSVSNLLGQQSARNNPASGVALVAAECHLDGFRFDNLGNSGVIVQANRQTIRNGRMQQMGVTANATGIRFSGASIDHTIDNIFVDQTGLSGTSGMTSSATITGMKVGNFRTRGTSSPTGSNISGLEITSVPGTGVTEYLVETPITRKTTATSTTLVAGDKLCAVTDTSSARTITLPAASAYPAGAMLIVKDESGAAATNNITVQRAGSDAIDGATTKVISANYGSIRLYSNGSTAWFSA